METISKRVVIRGRSPLLMNRYAGEQPSAEKAPRGKKLQSHIDASRKRGWESSAYFENGTFCIPPENVESAMSESAKAFRKGKDFKRAVMVEEDFLPLRVFSSPEDKKGVHLAGTHQSDFYKPEHIDVRGVSIGPARVDRCRPIFRHWGLEFTVVFDPEIISEDDLKQSLSKMNIGDFRPRFGRVMLEKFEDG